MKKILITGFDPFDGQSINPSSEIIKKLNDLDQTYQLIKLQVPVVFEESANLVIPMIIQEKPDVIILLGQAGGRKEISLERVAINIDDARIPDNKNNQPVDQVIKPDGKNAYFSTLPIRTIVNQLKDYPIGISNSAGTYVCNHLMYQVLYTLDIHHIQAKAGFIHVPFLPEQTNDPSIFSMSLDQMVHLINQVIHVIVED